MHAEVERRRQYHFGDRIRPQQRAPDRAVQTFVLQYDFPAAIPEPRLAQNTAARAALSADFEDVQVIGAKLDRETDLHCRQTEIPDPQAHVESVVPQKLRTVDMQRATRKEQCSVAIYVWIGEIDGYKYVIFTYRRIEQKRSALHELEFQAGKKSRSPKVDA